MTVWRNEMSILCNKLTPEGVTIGLGASTKEEVIHLLSRKVSDLYSLDCAQLIESEVLTRENMVPTCLGFECSIPHAHLNNLKDTYVVAANLSKKVSFSGKGEDTSIVFMIIGPERHAPLHLRLLSTIARLLHDGNLRKALTECTDEAQFVSILCGKAR